MICTFRLILLGLILFTVGGCVYDPPKETIAIINTSTVDTIYVYSAHCYEQLDLVPIPEHYFYDCGFQKNIKHPHFVEPLDTMKLSLGYTLLATINGCEDKEAKVFIFKTSSFQQPNSSSYLDKSMVDTVLSLTANTIKQPYFVYKPKD